jgi:MFS family permease
VTRGADPDAGPIAAPVGRSDALGRAFDLYRRTTSSRSALLLVAANVIPLAGVLFFGWSLWTILTLYWVENGIVGLWTVPKILLARASSDDARGRLALATAFVSPAIGAVFGPLTAIFFVFHYGLFWFVHGVFVFALPTFFGAGPLVTDPSLLTVQPSLIGDSALGVAIIVPATGPFGELVWSSVTIGAIGLFLSHGLSFAWTYVRGGEYRHTSPVSQAAAPYGRVVVLHVTILAGGFAIATLGAPLLLLFALVLGKTLLDLSLFLRQHAIGPRAIHAFRG